MKIKVENNAVEFIMSIPFKEESDEIFSLRSDERALCIIDAFSSRIQQVLSNRMEACMNLLRNHFADIFYNNGYTIAWHRKDGTIGYFNAPTYVVMQDAIKRLQMGDYEFYIQNGQMIEQTIKAIMNEPKMDRSDAGPYKFSELVSLLMEYLEKNIFEPNFQQEP